MFGLVEVMLFGAVAFAAGWAVGNWVRRMRQRGMTPEQIIAEAKALADEAAAKLKK